MMERCVPALIKNLRQTANKKAVKMFCEYIIGISSDVFAKHLFHLNSLLFIDNFNIKQILTSSPTTAWFAYKLPQRFCPYDFPSYATILISNDFVFSATQYISRSPS